MTASYTLKQYMQLWKVLEGYRDICELGWDVDIAIQTSTLELSLDTNYGWQLQQSLYCNRIQRNMNISIQPFGPIGFGLNSQHRQIVKDNIDAYDYFVYSEEDMLFTPHHFTAYLHQERKLRDIFPDTWINYSIGYLR